MWGTAGGRGVCHTAGLLWVLFSLPVGAGAGPGAAVLGYGPASFGAIRVRGSAVLRAELEQIRGGFGSLLCCVGV